MKKNIYLISGLGADRRVFDFLDLSPFNVHYVDWIDPIQNEAIESYSLRLVPQIKSEFPIILGVSFGGLIAIEISKLMLTEKLILLSTIKTRSDIPLIYRISGMFQLDRLIPVWFFKKVNWISYWFFGVKSDSDKKLLKTIIEETDPVFLKWAIRKIVSWQNTIVVKNSYHIHGDADRILPAKNADSLIVNGGHLMVISQAKEISLLINKLR